MGFDVIANAVSVLVRSTFSPAHANGIDLVAIAIAITDRDVVAATLVHLPRPIADATGIVGTDAGIHVIADAVDIRIFSAAATAVANDVQLVAIAVAVTIRDVFASTCIDLARSIANAAGVIVADARVFRVTQAVFIDIRSAITPALTNGIIGRAGAVLLGGGRIVVAG